VGTLAFIARKVAFALFTLWFVITVNFFLFRVMPSDPIAIMTRGQRLTSEDVAELKENLGLDKPMIQQYLVYLGNTVTGEWGRSVRSARPVTEEISERIWKTMLLVGLGTVFATGLGILIGIRGAWRRGSKFDQVSLYGSMTLYAMPEGWLAMLLILLLGGTFLAVFPAAGYDSGGSASGVDHWVDIGNHLFLPVLVLTLGYIGEYAIVMRASLLEMMGEDFVQTARAKGVPDRLVRKRHAVPNAILPTFTLVFLSFGFVIGGAIIVESIFSYPGLGQLSYQAVNELDYPILQAVFLIASASVILFNLIADLMYGYLDPRIRTQGFAR
jgi:peptide/nickel transport system permease protein